MKKQYIKREQQLITAVQLNLQTGGLRYQKWGNEQQCVAGDWLVDNEGDCYTINAATFASTYTRVSEGRYKKTAAVWAERATRPGRVKTAEGYTAYDNGDYIVHNRDDPTDSYAVSKEKFEKMYIACE